MMPFDKNTQTIHTPLLIAPIITHYGNHPTRIIYAKTDLPGKLGEFPDCSQNTHHLVHGL